MRLFDKLCKRNLVIQNTNPIVFKNCDLFCFDKFQGRDLRTLEYQRYQ